MFLSVFFETATAITMPQQNEYFIYIMASISKVLYIGFTNDLNRRVLEHKLRLKESFTAQYFVTRLVYYESFTSPWDGIYREKQLKRWRRAKKVWLIEEMNPTWGDLSDISEQEVQQVRKELLEDLSARSR